MTDRTIESSVKPEMREFNAEKSWVKREYIWKIKKFTNDLDKPTIM